MKAFTLTIFFVISFFLFYEYWKIKRRMKNKIVVEATCTDLIVRQFYNKKEYISYYIFNLNKEECKASDKSRLPLLKSFIKNSYIYVMYVNPKDEKDYVSPYEVKIYNLYLIGAILAIIIPLVLFL